MSTSLVEEGADVLENGARVIAAIFDSATTGKAAFAKGLSEFLRQETSNQTYRMAATIIVNALVFQDTIAGNEGPLKNINGIYKFKEKEGGPSKNDILDEWAEILKVNYWPIFGIARKIVSALPTAIWTSVFEEAFATADRLLSLNLGKNPDLIGIIFQRLISDRRFLATFYTAPSSAALLNGLVVNDKVLGEKSWADPDALSSLKIADFACGTGSLLCAAYAEVRRRIENHGLDSSTVHKQMIEEVLVGCDVLPSATHITASQLSSTFPTVSYEKTKMLTLPFGKLADGGVALGALDILETQAVMSTISTSSTKVGANEDESVDAWLALGGESVEDKSFDIVVMNPPFTRLTGGGGKTNEVSRPLFAAFKTTEIDQKAMSKKFSKLYSGSVYNGNAGAASAFVEIGHQKLKVGGSTGLILPLSALSGSSWEACRILWAHNYADLMVLSIAGRSGSEMAFSADTGVGEAVVVGTRSDQPSKRYTSISLYRRPSSVIEGTEIARQIRELIAGGAVSNLESGPFGGSELNIGTEKVGEIITAPIPANGPWRLFRVSDHTIAQLAFQLSDKGRVWLPGVPEKDARSLAFCKLGELGLVGPYHLDVSGSGKSGGVPRGPFKLKATSSPASVTYPVLKAHNEARERYLEITSDAEGLQKTDNDPVIQAKIDSKRDAVWATRSRLHFATDLQFNANALVSVLTDRASIGGRAWPSFKIAPEYEKFANLWFNSTLGIICYWWIANKALNRPGIAGGSNS